MNAAKRRAIYERLRSLNPHPRTELEYGTPFQLLVAVVLSAQATDKGVNAATRKLYPVANTPQALLDLGHFLRKQLDHESRGAARQHDLRATLGGVDALQHSAHAVAAWTRPSPSCSASRVRATSMKRR